MMLAAVGLGIWLWTRDRGGQDSGPPQGARAQGDLASDSNPTYDDVIKNPTRYIGKRVTWPINPWEGTGKEMLCSLKSDSLRDPNLHGLYFVEFASNEEVVKAFESLVDISKPRQQHNVTGALTGVVDRPITITHHGEAVAQPKMMKVPLLSHPVFTLAEKTSEKK